MLNAIINYSIKNKLIILLLVFGLIVGGTYSLTKLPIDAVPDITNNQVLVITSAPGLGAPDVERLITVPIEQATRNVPGVIEQRSFSRFGLGLVTLVFNDETDVYWARQQVNERLFEVRQQLPAGMGYPELGPVTTGLGEIFQYVVRAKPGYESKYRLSELREIQDWIVRRQLLGTEGVADVSSFGGAVKQYEVSVNPAKLNSFQLTLADVYKALQSNNQNAGGAYIEKGPNVLFIRSEGLVKSLDDIRNIVVKQVNAGIPVLISDVADVDFGNAVRYGAMVFNDEGEVSGGIVMMLKGENSNKVIRLIKERITEIEKTLPEGVMIEAFLDRTKMVNNAISTVEKNLAEGALIVVFVLVIFLGNLRAGFIVASVIPLSMLFAVIMMNLFGVTGNLMSLGALDFGLLVDGAVIIVEAVMHKLSLKNTFRQSNRLTQSEMNAEVGGASKKMMNSAVFGQIIILIVYLPILSLRGIEGKMFRPMAETVSFAIIGAFILSLTYVPMMSSLLMSKKYKSSENFSDKMMRFLQRIYQPVLAKAMKIPVLIVAGAFVLFTISAAVMSTLGGEFIPQLEEGDFAVDTRLLTGSSLTNTVETVQKTSKVLLDNFPEVEKIVTKIGSGEIPTDPMPLEAADMMVILKDKKEWKSAKSFPELANKMSTVLQEVPGVATGFQFPVQMRFNELMTGARQDVVCKIFGEDLDTLALYASKFGNIIQTVHGAKDLYTETVTGIPQMVISFNRAAIARYGANISDINTTIQSAYAGAVAGEVFESDRRYDLVIRMAADQKRELSDLDNLLVGLPDGQQVPLKLLATIEMKEGPYQIQREDAQRRITIGFNVRGQDVQTIVNELQQKVSTQIKLPPGYYITYGGQYENLQHATQRLSIALPIALLLIFLMLYFAFHKIKYCLLIFSAIPLSAIGGVWALWLRDMPFSISAGVGFIALFGVAVLNGIVLISEMNRLKEEGHYDLINIIMKATNVRLRPVLMTASVASLGFLPMALSNGAGAEVQRPLATVVIGGLLTATLLTLFVLPALYLLIERGKKLKVKPSVIAIIICLSVPALLQAQTRQPIHLNEAVEIAVQQNLQIKRSTLQEQYFNALKQSAAALPKTEFNAEMGQINSARTDNRFSVTQTFSMPGFYKKQRNLFEAQWQGSMMETTLLQSEIKKLVKQAYLQLQYDQSLELLLKKMDSVYSAYLKIAQLRFEKGESNLLEKTKLDNEVQQVRMRLKMLQADKVDASIQLGVLLNRQDVFEALDSLTDETVLQDTTQWQQHAYLQLYRQQQQIAYHETQVEKAKLQPDILLGYHNQSIIGFQQNKDGTEQYYDGGKRFSSVQVGVGISLFNKAQKARILAAKEREAVAATSSELAAQTLKTKLQQHWNGYLKYKELIQYYRNSALPQSELIIKTANLNYKNGGINYIEWGSLINNALSVQAEYVDALKELNVHQIELEYLLQPK